MNTNKNNPNNKNFEGRPDSKPKAQELDEMEEVPAEDIQVADDLEEEDTEATTVPREKLIEVEEQLAKEKKDYLFLAAEFDNFRKRTIREKSDLIKNAGETVLKGLLPIVDDFERGLNASKGQDNAQAIFEGMELIYNKLIKYLEKNGVKAIDPEDREFDTSRHEAISAVPVQDEAQKGKILDTVEKGYMLNDKVLRHAKVVVGQ